MKDRKFTIKSSQLALSPHGFVIVADELTRALKEFSLGDIPVLAAGSNQGCINEECKGGSNGNEDCTNHSC